MKLLNNLLLRNVNNESHYNNINATEGLKFFDKLLLNDARIVANNGKLASDFVLHYNAQLVEIP